MQQLSKTVFISIPEIKDIEERERESTKGGTIMFGNGQENFAKPTKILA